MPGDKVLKNGIVSLRTFPKLGRVRGEVRLDGRPLANCQVTFEPKGELTSTATTDAQGRFQLHYNGTHPGAVPGIHVVRLNANPSESLGVEIPAKYSQESGLRMKIYTGENSIHLELTSQ